jgi:ribosome-associated heat shock protein Hsp15
VDELPAGRPDPVRLDKWLWAARFYKSRSLATDAVNGGHVRVNGRAAKPSRPVAIGDTVSIQKGQLAWTVVVRETSARRGGASIAATLYAETQESLAGREAALDARRAERARFDQRLGARPSKRDRRRLERWRGRREDEG